MMFLNEVVLGKEHTITKDDSSLMKAPDGYDSVVARGKVEPGTAPPLTAHHSQLTSGLIATHSLTLLTKSSHCYCLSHGQSVSIYTV